LDVESNFVTRHLPVEMNHARSSILNGYGAVRQQADVAGGVLGPDIDGVLPIDELRGIENEVEGSIEGAPGKAIATSGRGMFANPEAFLQYIIHIQFDACVGDVGERKPVNRDLRLLRLPDSF
jgi:hypothetical protein